MGLFIYCPFHKPNSSAFVNWLSVRFYETNCTSTNYGTNMNLWCGLVYLQAQNLIQKCAYLLKACLSIGTKSDTNMYICAGGLFIYKHKSDTKCTYLLVYLQAQKLPIYLCVGVCARVRGDEADKGKRDEISLCRVLQFPAFNHVQPPLHHHCKKQARISTIETRTNVVHRSDAKSK